jgi:hypothetical protein
LTDVYFADGAKVAYFRGRKLHGKSVKLPEGYQGIVVQKGDTKVAPTAGHASVEAGDEEEQFPRGTLESKAEFDELVVWGHEEHADASSDPYVRGIEEWLSLADQVSIFTIPDHYLSSSLTLPRYIHTRLRQLLDLGCST